MCDQHHRQQRMQMTLRGMVTYLKGLITSLGVTIITFLVFMKSVFTSNDVLPELVSKESALTKHLLKRCCLLRRPFRPGRFSSNPYVQTFLGYFLPKEDVQFEREYLQMNDKGIVALDWLINSKFKIRKSNSIILIFPRMTGDAVSVGRLCLVGAQRGFRVVVYNRRGHGSSLLATPKLTSTGDPSDVRQVVEYIRMKFPKANLTAVGVGAGCSSLFSYLGEYGSSTLLKAGICLSPSYDISGSLSENMPKIYELLLLISLKQIIIRNAKALSKVINFEAAMKSWTLKDFDFNVYCAMYGFDNFQAFMDKNDPMRDADEISVPVMCINSLDDPVARKENIPFDLFEFYPNLLLVTLEKGGHCGFLEDFPPRSWAERLAVDYLEAVLEFTSNRMF